MKVFDNFLFNGDTIVQLRLKYLYPVIDHFYICEKRYTHQGQRKDNLYIESCAEWFEPYKSKCTFLVDESEPFATTWESERFHRNYSIPFIPCDEPFLLLCADVDEIPELSIFKEKEKVYELCKEGAITLKQKMYYYNLNWFVHDWYHPFLINDIVLRENPDLELYRGKTGKMAGVIPCGWHFSYFMDRSSILRKIESFAHDEYNHDSYKDGEFIDDCLRFGLDLYKRDWIPPFTREDPYAQGYPQFFLDFHENLLQKQLSNPRV